MVITLGETFSDVVLVLKRTAFDGMKQEEEEEDIIEVKIRQLMAETMAAATAPTPRDEDEVQDNIDKWKALGVEAYETDSVKYANATKDTLGGYRITGEGIVEVNDCFLSVDSSNIEYDYEYVYIDENVEGVKWNADLPSFKDGSSGNWGIEYGKESKIIEWNGKLPNLVIGWGMFYGCTGLNSWTVELPNSLINANSMFNHCSGLKSFSTPSGTLPNSLTDVSNMFYGCSGLTSWTVELPDSLTDAAGMFSDCSGLKSFSTPSGTLPNSLITTQNMFYGCTGLKSFTPSLAGLTKCGNFEWMFVGCILNEASIRNILGTLPNRKGKGQLTISIGGDKTMEQSVKDDLSSLAQSVSTTKNWNIVLNWNPWD